MSGGEHVIHESVIREGSGVEVVRRRAFCSCGWCSEKTWNQETHAAAITAHLAASPSPMRATRRENR